MSWIKKIIRIAVVVVVVANAFAFGFNENKIMTDDELIKISGIYGRDIPVAEINDAQLVESIPSVQRKVKWNGFPQYSQRIFLG